MPSIPQFLSWGIWPAIPLTGMLLIKYGLGITRSVGLPFFPSFALQWVTGLSVWSMVLLPYAYFGLFNACCFGAVGWLLVVGWVAILLRCKDKVLWPDTLFTFDRSDILLTMGIGGAFALYALYPAESIWGGRDMGTYANHAISISREGDLAVPMPNVAAAKDFIFKYFWVHPGMARVGDGLTVHLPSLYQVWLAQAFSSFGPGGMFRMNAFFAILFFGAFYGIIRLALNYKVMAILAILFLAFNVSQIWVTRQTLTETFNQLFLWTGMLSFVTAWRMSQKNLARLAGLIIGTATLIRIDSFVIIPLFFFAHLMTKVVEATSPQRKSSIFQYFYQTVLPFCAVSLFYYRFINIVYFNQQLDKLILVGYATLIVGLFLLLCNRNVAHHLARIFAQKYMILAFGAITILLMLYAYYLRPLQNSLDEFHFRNSAVNLSKYTSLFIFWSGVVGWLLCLYKVLLGKSQVVLCLVLAAVGGFTALYLWRPNIYPDHFWAIRRFVPIIIPGFIFYAFYLMDQALKLLPHSIRLPGTAILIVFLGVFTFQSGNIVFTFAEHKGAFGAIEAIAAELPKDELILLQEYSEGELSVPLHLSHGYNVLPVNLDQKPGPEILRKWLKRNKKPIYLLSNSKPLPKDVQAELVKKMNIPFARTLPTINPLPQDNLITNRIISLYRVSEVSGNYFGMNLALENLMGVKHSGFYAPQKAPNGDLFRWTTGKAKISVPLENNSPQRIRFDFENSGSQGKNVQLLFNGQTLFQGDLPAGNWSKWFDVDSDQGSSGRISPFRDEFLHTKAGGEEFLRLLYRKLLNREPDRGGIQYWMNQLNNHQDRASIANSFLSAPEFEKMYHAHGISQANPSIAKLPPHKSSVHTFISKFHEQLHHRKPTPSELVQWTRFLTNGSKGGADFLRALIFKQEFIDRNTLNGRFMYEKNMIVIEINSDTFHPDPKKEQPLGVAVRSIRLR